MKNMPHPILNSQKMILTSKKSTLNSKPSPCSVCIYLWSERKKLNTKANKNSDHSRQKINIQHLKSQFNISNTSDQSTSSLIFFLLLPVPIPKTSPSNGRIIALQKEEFRYKNMDSTLPATRKEFSTFIYHQVDSQGLVSVLLIAAMIIPRNIMVSTFMEDTSTLPHTN